MGGFEAIKHSETKLRDVGFRVEEEIEVPQVVDLNQQEEDLRIAGLYAKCNWRDPGRVARKEDCGGCFSKVFMMGDSYRLRHASHIMVGKHNEFKTMEMLSGHPSKHQVISIFGMGCLGKTTLIIQIFESPSIISHLYERAWVVVA